MMLAGHHDYFATLVSALAASAVWVACSPQHRKVYRILIDGGNCVIRAIRYVYPYAIW